jgi:hypothetical protein
MGYAAPLCAPHSARRGPRIIRKRMRALTLYSWTYGTRKTLLALTASTSRLLKNPLAMACLP